MEYVGHKIWWTAYKDLDSRVKISPDSIACVELMNPLQRIYGNLLSRIVANENR
jgi:hypothetical protein